MLHLFEGRFGRFKRNWRNTWVEGTGAEVEFYQYVISIIWKAVHVCLGALSCFCNVFRLLGLCDFPFQKKNKGNAGCWLHSHCCLFPHQFWTGSKICSSGSSATSRLYCWYFVTLARLLLLPCYYPYKKQTILYIAADNFLDHDLILVRIYIYIYIALAVGFLSVMMGYFQVGTNASGMAQPCPCLPTPGILGTENQFTWQFS